MKPFLSVLHAKAHDWKCEIIWGGRNQEGSGTTIGEEVEQVNSFLSRVALTTKYMTKAETICLHCKQWAGIPGKLRACTGHCLRYRKTKQRAKAEADSLQSFMVDLNCSVELRDQWVADVKQWALTVTDAAPGSPQESQKIIEGLFGSLREKKHNLYRQNDSNKQRQKKRRHLSKVKAKLLEAIHQYNPAVPNAEKIDVLAASDPDENVVWPWEMLPNDTVGLSSRRKIFDKVMLVSRASGRREHSDKRNDSTLSLPSRNFTEFETPNSTNKRRPRERQWAV
ncbi:uncharacterized protein [Hoplias malabaricus]|uniref:uncharacterized protein isoform X2 n=1 Tax=Hoplias malabaricus TaxID=27720 RepID=UPI0034627328